MLSLHKFSSTIFLTSSRQVSLKLTHLLSGEILVSYRGHLIPGTSSGNLAALPGPPHIFQLTFQATANVHTRWFRSFFIFRQLLAPAKTLCPSYMLNFQVRQFEVNCQWRVSVLLPPALAVCARILYLSLGCTVSATYYWLLHLGAQAPVYYCV